jgi:hypothetical protein
MFNRADAGFGPAGAGAAQRPSVELMALEQPDKAFKFDE